MKKILAMLLALTMIVGMAACGGGKDTEKLVMATNATFPPYEFIEDGSGKIIGIDAEIAAKIAEKLGMELVIQDIDFSTIIGSIKTGKVDMGMAGMTVTPDRLEEVNFSKSYATGVQVVIVKDGGKVASLDDLNADGIKIGVQQNTTGDIYASAPVEEGGYGVDKVVPYLNGPEAVAALVAGKVDAVIIDNEPAKAYVASNEGLSILDTPYAEEDYAIAVAKENTELLEKIDKALDELIADGTVASIVEKYIPSK